MEYVRCVCVWLGAAWVESGCVGCKELEALTSDHLPIITTINTRHYYRLQTDEI